MRTQLGPERGVRIALDWGRARIGVAACDPDGVLAYPVCTIDARNDPMRQVRAVLAEYEPVEVVLGWPIDLRGREGPAARAMAANAEQLAALVGAEKVVCVDERLSTAEAARRLSATGKDSRARRGIIDQAAAVGILEHALATRVTDSGRLQGDTRQE